MTTEETQAIEKKGNGKGPKASAAEVDADAEPESPSPAGPPAQTTIPGA